MKIIPVIDLKDGEVVRGIGGRRAEYRRVQSILTSEATPGGIARAFAERLGAQEVYVADLDAIAGGEPDWRAYEAIGRCGMRLWVDAGIGDERRAAQLAGFRQAELKVIVVGLETITNASELPAMLNTLGKDRAAFSLDLKHGRPLTLIDAWRGLAPEAITQHVLGLGFSRLIVLDLAHVGEQQGVGGVELCQRLHQQFPQVELISGGGVRSLTDLQALASAGCRKALVASALHDGRIAAEEAARLCADE